MRMIGKVDSLWRYPVKSMRGEQLPELFVGKHGVLGDRLFAFESSASPTEFPYFTGRNQPRLLLCRPRFVAADATVEVETPSGRVVPIDHPGLIDILRDGADPKHQLRLRRSDSPLTDCQPLSILSLQTVRQLSDETGLSLDKRRFRANIYLDLAALPGFAEDELVGRKLRLGQDVVASVVKRDGRCVMITIDPDTAETEPAILKKVAQAHEGMTGIYAMVVAEGTVRAGDPVEVLD